MNSKLTSINQKSSVGLTVHPSLEFQRIIRGSLLHLYASADLRLGSRREGNQMVN